MTQEVKCPSCGSQKATFKQKAQQWECGDCEIRFTVDAVPRHLKDKALEPKHIFFSYGHDDNQELVDRFKADLEKRGHTVWIDYKKIGTWDDWKGRITQGIIDSNMAIAFLSKHSTRDPGVCRSEIAMAVHHFGTVYPVLVEPLSQNDVPVTIQNLQWPDLSKWRDIKRVSEVDYNRWYEEKLIEIINKIEGECTRFAVETKVLRDILCPSSFDSKIAQHIEGFVGRDWIFDAFKDWLENKPESRIFWLKAGPGFGKTALAVNLSNRNRAAIVGTWFCDHQSIELRDPRRALKTLAFQLAIRCDDYRTRLLPRLGIYEDSQAEQLKEARDELEKKSVPDLFSHLIAEPLAGLIWREHKLVILIDALDEATDEQGHNYLTDLVSQQFRGLPSWISLVVTSRPEASVVNRLQGFKSFDLVGSDERNLADLRAYCEQSLFKRNEFIALTREERERLQNLLIAKSEGMVLYLKLIEEGLKEGTLTLEGIENLESGLPGLYRRYYDSFNSRLSQDYEASIKPLLRLILAAPGPLPAELARMTLRWNKEVFNACRNQLGSYLVDTLDGLQLFHKTLHEWLGDEISAPFYLDTQPAKQALAEYLWQGFESTVEKRKLEWPKQTTYLWQSFVCTEDTLKLEWSQQIQYWLPGLIQLLPQWDDADALYQFGKFIARTANYPTAKILFYRSLSLREKALGVNHPLVALVISELWSAARNEELYQFEAIEIRDYIELRDRELMIWTLNQDVKLIDLDVANALANLALDLNFDIKDKVDEYLGENLNQFLEKIKIDTKVVISLLKRSLLIREEIQGLCHPQVAQVLEKLSEVLEGWENKLETLAFSSGFQGKFVLADLFEKPTMSDSPASKQLKELFGEQVHPAFWFIDEYAGAEDLLRRALTIYENTDLRSVGYTLIKLANLMENRGDYSTAIQMRLREKDIYETQRDRYVKENGQPDALAGDFTEKLEHIGLLYFLEGDDNKAEKFIRDAVAVVEMESKNDFLENLAQKFIFIEYVDDSIIYDRALSILLKIANALNYNDVDILFANLFIDWQITNGNDEVAELMGLEIVEYFEQTNRTESLHLADILDSMAVFKEKKEDLSGAESMLRWALAIRGRVLDNEHQEFSISLFKLAEFLKTKGDYTGAESLFRRALLIQEKSFGEGSLPVRNSLLRLGTLLDTQGRYIEAEQLYRRAIAIKDETFNSMFSVGMAKADGMYMPPLESLRCLASCLGEQGGFDEAKSLLTEVINTRTGILGTNHGETLQAQGWLARLYKQSGNFSEARVILNDALTKAITFLGKEHEVTKMIYNDLNLQG